MVDHNRVAKHLYELESAISKPTPPSHTASSIPRPEPLDLSPIDIGMFSRCTSTGTTDMDLIMREGLSILPPTSPLTPMSPCDDQDDGTKMELYFGLASCQGFGKKPQSENYCEKSGKDGVYEATKSPIESESGENHSEHLGMELESLMSVDVQDFKDVRETKMEIEPLVLSPSIGFGDTDKGRQRGMGVAGDTDMDVELLLRECHNVVTALKEPVKSSTVVKIEDKAIDDLCCSSISTSTVSTSSQRNGRDGSIKVKEEAVAPRILPGNQAAGEVFFMSARDDVDEDELRESSYRIFAVTADQKVGLRKKSRTYSKAIASRFCHICTRQRKGPDSHATCHNVQNGTCRKSVCQKCFKRFGWDWEAVQHRSEPWLCPHCCNLCPTSAQCYNYEKAAQRKSEKKWKSNTVKTEARLEREATDL